MDGKPTPIRRADPFFQAVKVPAGTHRITFRFTPFALSNLRDAMNLALGRHANAEGNEAK
jgi:hypothetical protein